MSHAVEKKLMHSRFTDAMHAFFKYTTSLENVLFSVRNLHNETTHLQNKEDEEKKNDFEFIGKPL